MSPYQVRSGGVEEQSNRGVDFIVGKTIKEVIPEIDQPWMDKFSSVIIDNKSIQFSFGNDKTFKSYNVNAFSIEENKIVMIIEDITAEKIAFENLILQNIEKEKLADELIIANKELAFQDSEKVKRSAEFVVANKELLFQNPEKEKRASELVIANEELYFQRIEKEKSTI